MSQKTQAPTNNRVGALQSKGFKFSSGTISETSDKTIPQFRSCRLLRNIVGQTVAAGSNQAREINARRKERTSTRANPKNGE